MRKLTFAIVGSVSLALAGCGGQGDDTLGEQVEENMDAQADNLDALADNAATDAEAAALGNEADALREAGDEAEDRIDDADVNAANQAAADQAVQGM